MNTRKTLVVVDDSRFYAVRDKIVTRDHRVASLADLLEQSEKFGFTHVWIVAGSGLSRACMSAPDPSGWSIRAMRTSKGLAYCSAIRLQDSQEKRIQIAVTERLPWPFEGRDNPKTLLATLAYLEDALGLPIEWTPGHMAIEVIRQKNASRWSWLAPMVTNLEDDSGFKYSIASKEITDWRSKVPRQGQHYIKIDGNSDYGAGMTGLACGEGNPSRVAGKQVDVEYDGRRPGFWSVEILNCGMWDGKQLPSFQEHTWMSTDLIEILRADGMEIIVTKGWYWPSHHQTLRSTISNKEKTGLWDLRLLWRAQREKSPAHENVYEAISAILHTVHGKLGDDDIFDKRFYRPDLYALVVARAVARRVYHLKKIYRQYGVLPQRIHVDGFEYAVNDPHIFDDMLDRSKLGGFKRVEMVKEALKS